MCCVPDLEVGKMPVVAFHCLSVKRNEAPLGGVSQTYAIVWTKQLMDMIVAGIFVQELLSPVLFDLELLSSKYFVPGPYALRSLTEKVS